MKVAETHVSVHSSHHPPLDVESGGFLINFLSNRRRAILYSRLRKPTSWKEVLD